MVVASGAGNGHGIGMCQWGAMGMARAGLSYREILGHYYKHTRLRME
jgi:stage II sporulation protein D